MNNILLTFIQFVGGSLILLLAGGAVWWLVTDSLKDGFDAEDALAALFLGLVFTVAAIAGLQVAFG